MSESSSPSSGPTQVQEALAQVPGLVAEYFSLYHPGVTEHPVITCAFRPGEGWTAPGSPERVSLSRLRRLQAGGTTGVELTAGGFAADFTPEEIEASARRPLVGGRLI